MLNLFRRTKRNKRIACHSAGRSLRLEELEDRRVLATLTVNLTTDASQPVNDGNLTIREAIAYVNQTNVALPLDAQRIDTSVDPLGVNDKIKFDSALSGATITLAHGELAISRSVEIDASLLMTRITINAGGGTNGIVGNFDGHSVFRVFDSGDGVEINSLILTGGDSPLAGGAIAFFASSGPGLSVKNSRITGNATEADGGGIYANGSLSLEGTTIDGNTAANFGGGISTGATLSVVSSTISGNTAVGSGGGIRALYSPSVNIQSSHITGNQSQTSERVGAGIWAYTQELHIELTTISNNSCTFDSISGLTNGGGLWAGGGSITIEQSTFEINKLIGFNSLGAGAWLESSGGSITITDTTFSSNEALGLDGNAAGLAIKASSNSNVVMDRVKIVGNHADDDIGGLYIENEASDITLKNSTVSGNTASHNNDYDGAGGAWIQTLSGGVNYIEDSTISDNQIVNSSSASTEKWGGGLLLRNASGTTTTLRNVTISGNQAQGSGGGVKIGEDIVAGGEVHILHSTIVNNRADSDDDEVGLGGGIHIGESNPTLVILDHTIVAGNFSGAGTSRDDINGAVTATWSLIGDGTGATITGGNNLIGNSTTAIDPQLAALADNGGPTQTHSLKLNSPAFNAGNPTISGEPEFDQRGDGYPRIRGLTIDIGAYEVQPARVSDVLINGIMMPSTQEWTRGAYSFAELVPQGKQLAPIFTAGANTISIQFTEDVGFAGDPLTLYRTPARYSTILRQVQPTATFVYDPDSRTATWTYEAYDTSINYFANPTLAAKTLFPDRYRISLDQTKVHSGLGASGNGLALDGAWVNQTNGTLYYWNDDQTNPPRHFPSGNGMGGTPFDFLFAYLPGDYDQNGVVNAGDEAVWAHQYGIADGNGDGETDKSLPSADHAVWAAYGNYGLFGRSTGDYNHDGRVGLEDYVLWRQSFGSTTVLDADGNDDSSINAQDYTVWRTWWTEPDPDLPIGGTVTAWDLSARGSAAGAAIADSTSAPKVLNVTISGSNSVHDAYSFATHVGSGEQLKTVPVGGADTVSITFNEQVNVEAPYLRIAQLRFGQEGTSGSRFIVPALVDFSYDVATMTATWCFETLPANDQYLISLSDAVTDLQGYRLDGEWTNPETIATTNSLVSEFPSGDGHAGGSFNFVITLLAGDSSLNDWISVDIDDYEIWEANYGQAGGFDDGDFSGDGIVDETDLDLLYGNEGIDLTAVQMWGDLNGDWVVDDLDAQIIIDNFGMSVAALDDGDLNRDAVVNINDLDYLFSQYGLELSAVA